MQSYTPVPISCANGPEPYIAAIRAGAQVVLGGRTTDTQCSRPCRCSWAPMRAPRGMPQRWPSAAVNARSPASRRGADENPSAGLRDRTLDAENRATPESVSPHVVRIERPYRLTDRAGSDVTRSIYTQINDRVTRVTGSVWLPMPYTMKLEGAKAGDFQTLMFIGMRTQKCWRT